jgi:hypothetical protein
MASANAGRTYLPAPRRCTLGTSFLAHGRSALATQSSLSLPEARHSYSKLSKRIATLGMPGTLTSSQYKPPGFSAAGPPWTPVKSCSVINMEDPECLHRRRSLTAR